MATGTKTFMVAALMAIAAIFGSFGASNAAPIYTMPQVDVVN